MIKRGNNVDTILFWHKHLVLTNNMTNTYTYLYIFLLGRWAFLIIYE